MTEKKIKKLKQKERSQQKYIYTHLYINLKTLYKWVVIYMMLTLRGEKKKTLYNVSRGGNEKKTFKKGDNVQVQQAISKAINTTGPIALWYFLIVE